MIGFYNYTVIATYMGFGSGIMGVFFALNGKPFAAMVCLMLAGLCDAFDGRIARTRTRSKEEMRFGIQIDSLSDLICFGVLPGVIGYSQGMQAWWQIAIIILYALAALVRLAYFNVLEETSMEETSQSERICHGMPVTTASLLFPMCYGLHRVLRIFPVVYSVLMAAAALAFVVDFKVKKPGIKGVMVLVLIGLVEIIVMFWLAR